MRTARQFLVILGCLLANIGWLRAEVQEPIETFPRPLSSYADKGLTASAQLLGRLKVEPLNGIASLIFFLAIIHTFAAPKFMALSHRYTQEANNLSVSDDSNRKIRARQDSLRFRGVMCHFLGEVEAIFGIWLLPLGAVIAMMKGFPAVFKYLDEVRFAEPIFVATIMVMAGSLPILRFTETCLAAVASLGGKSVAAWWFSILTLGPLLGSLITEPAAMTLCALLLTDRFFSAQPRMPLKYATLGLLFVNISVGGTLTHFAAPPVVMVASKWGWGIGYMLQSFGWKAALSILISNVLFFLVFHRELLSLSLPNTGGYRPRFPIWITLTHMAMMGWVVFSAHHPSVVILTLLVFLAFVLATPNHQEEIAFRGPLLVGFFLAALVIHGGFQQWWIAPILQGLGRWPLMISSMALTAFNDNAAITYLASLVPDLSDPLKYAVVAGAIAGGGLTVIANAPNPAGQTLLQKFFGEDGVHPAYLFAAAIVPTLILGVFLMLFP